NPDILNSVEPRYPGFANWGGQYSNRYMWQGSLRSTLGKSMVNEARIGWSGGTTQWYPEVAASQFACNDAGCQGGYNLGIGNTGFNIGTNLLTSATASTSPSTRFVPDLVIEDTLSWLKGRHTLNIGGSFTQIKFENWALPGGVVEGVTLGTVSTDPAYGLFANASNNFPGGISSTYEGYARNLYALLTGRVSSIGSSTGFVLDADGQYKHLGERWQLGRQHNIGLFVSDSWRVTQTLTLTGGVRYEMQTPFSPDMSTWARPDQWTDIYGISGLDGMFKPGTLAGRTPIYALYGKGDKAYNTDTNNFAPSVGFAWRTNLGDNFLGKILGREPVFRGGYSIAYTRYGTGDFTDVYGRNPGSTSSATRSISLGNLGAPPVLLSQKDRLAPPATPGAPSYPFSPAINETVAVMDPDLKVPFTHQYSFGWQRELGKTMAMELRYVGNRFMGQWSTTSLNNWQNRFLVENGFMEEFKKAQANLRANIAAGKGNTFAYTGVAGTSPLPIFLAHFAGLPQGQAGDPSKYTASQFSSSAWYNSLSPYNPNISTITGTGTSGLQSTSFTANMAKAGLPRNFWVANPDVAQGDARLTYNAGNTRYDGLQFDMRRRMSKGLLLAGSYTWGRSLTWSRPTLRNEAVELLSTWNLDHSLKFNWVYELPFGHNRRFGSGVSTWMNRLIGGWEFDGAARMQSGQVLNFNNNHDYQYRLVGMSQEEFQDMFKLRKVQDANGKTRLYMLPMDVIENSILALSTASATSSTGYSGAVPTGKYIAWANSPECVQAYAGQCQPLELMVRGPWVFRSDFSFVKRIPVARSSRIELRMDIFNVFDNINFIPRTVSTSATSLTAFELTSAFQDINASQDPGGRITQFGLRFTW
ncbi:MAG TPA: hypothetical protein VK911_07775, partial [Vicinamibacterales bacterium]|nr:hypothetical protein [Vicinamibacterales bacterium]